MTDGEKKAVLRYWYNSLFGPGYFGADVETYYVALWNNDPANGAARVYYDIMANHGGDDALRKRPGFGTWH